MTEVVKSIDKLKEPGIEACKLFLKVCREKNIDIFITETYRSKERQQYLYQKGVSRCDGIKNKSAHQSGLAWDIACRGKELYSHKILNNAGEVAKELGIVWGGNWKSFIDKPHFEVSKNWENSRKVDNTVVVLQKIYINDLYKDVESIVENGFNFIKLRDLECSRLKADYRDGDIWINDKKFKGNTIKKCNLNYIKVRDLELLGIIVRYDSNLKTIIINC